MNFTTLILLIFTAILAIGLSIERVKLVVPENVATKEPVDLHCITLGP